MTTASSRAAAVSSASGRAGGEMLLSQNVSSITTSSPNNNNTMITDNVNNSNNNNINNTNNNTSSTATGGGLSTSPDKDILNFLILFERYFGLELTAYGSPVTIPRDRQRGVSVFKTGSNNNINNSNETTFGAVGAISMGNSTRLSPSSLPARPANNVMFPTSSNSSSTMSSNMNNSNNANNNNTIGNNIKTIGEQALPEAAPVPPTTTPPVQIMHKAREAAHKRHLDISRHVLALGMGANNAHSSVVATRLPVVPSTDIYSLPRVPLHYAEACLPQLTNALRTLPLASGSTGLIGGEGYGSVSGSNTYNNELHGVRVFGSVDIDSPIATNPLEGWVEILDAAPRTEQQLLNEALLFSLRRASHVQFQRILMGDTHSVDNDYGLGPVRRLRGCLEPLSLAVFPLPQQTALEDETTTTLVRKKRIYGTSSGGPVVERAVNERHEGLFGESCTSSDTTSSKKETNSGGTTSTDVTGPPYSSVSYVRDHSQCQLRAGDVQVYGACVIPLAFASLPTSVKNGLQALERFVLHSMESSTSAPTSDTRVTSVTPAAPRLAADTIHNALIYHSMLAQVLIVLRRHECYEVMLRIIYIVAPWRFAKDSIRECFLRSFISSIFPCDYAPLAQLAALVSDRVFEACGGDRTQHWGLDQLEWHDKATEWLSLATPSSSPSCSRTLSALMLFRHLVENHPDFAFRVIAPPSVVEKLEGVAVDVGTYSSMQYTFAALRYKRFCRFLPPQETSSFFNIIWFALQDGHHTRLRQLAADVLERTVTLLIMRTCNSTTALSALKEVLNPMIAIAIAGVVGNKVYSSDDEHDNDDDEISTRASVGPGNSQSQLFSTRHRRTGSGESVRSTTSMTQRSNLSKTDAVAHSATLVLAAIISPWLKHVPCTSLRNSAPAPGNNNNFTDTMPELNQTFDELSGESITVNTYGSGSVSVPTVVRTVSMKPEDAGGLPQFHCSINNSSSNNNSMWAGMNPPSQKSSPMTRLRSPAPPPITPITLPPGSFSANVNTAAVSSPSTIPPTTGSHASEFELISRRQLDELFKALNIPHIQNSAIRLQQLCIIPLLVQLNQTIAQKHIRLALKCIANLVGNSTITVLDKAQLLLTSSAAISHVGLQNCFPENRSMVNDDGGYMDQLFKCLTEYHRLDAAMTALAIIAEGCKEENVNMKNQLAQEIARRLPAMFKAGEITLEFTVGLRRLCAVLPLEKIVQACLVPQIDCTLKNGLDFVAQDCMHPSLRDCYWTGKETTKSIEAKLACFRVLRMLRVKWPGASSFFCRVCTPYFKHPCTFIRKECVECCVKLLTSECDENERMQDGTVVHQGKNHLLTLAAVVKQLVCVAVSDNDEEIRMHALNSLQEEAVVELLFPEPEIINNLFYIVADESHQVSLAAIRIIRQLTHKNPSLTTPELIRLLLQLADQVYNASLDVSSSSQISHSTLQRLLAIMEVIPTSISFYLSYLLRVMTSILRRLDIVSPAVCATSMRIIAFLFEECYEDEWWRFPPLTPLILDYVESVEASGVDGSFQSSTTLCLRLLPALDALTCVTQACSVSDFHNFGRIVRVLHRLLLQRYTTDTALMTGVMRLLGTISALEPSQPDLLALHDNESNTLTKLMQNRGFSFTRGRMEGVPHDILNMLICILSADHHSIDIYRVTLDACSATVTSEEICAKLNYYVPVMLKVLSGLMDRRPVLRECVFYFIAKVLDNVIMSVTTALNFGALFELLWKYWDPSDPAIVVHLCNIIIPVNRHNTQQNYNVNWCQTTLLGVAQYYCTQENLVGPCMKVLEAIKSFEFGMITSDVLLILIPALCNIIDIAIDPELRSLSAAILQERLQKCTILQLEVFATKVLDTCTSFLTGTLERRSKCLAVICTQENIEAGLEKLVPQTSSSSSGGVVLGDSPGATSTTTTASAKGKSGGFLGMFSNIMNKFKQREKTTVSKDIITQERHKIYSCCSKREIQRILDDKNKVKEKLAVCSLSKFNMPISDLCTVDWISVDEIDIVALLCVVASKTCKPKEGAGGTELWCTSMYQPFHRSTVSAIEERFSRTLQYPWGPVASECNPQLKELGVLSSFLTRCKDIPCSNKDSIFVPREKDAVTQSFVIVRHDGTVRDEPTDASHANRSPDAMISLLSKPYSNKTEPISLYPQTTGTAGSSSTSLLPREKTEKTYPLFHNIYKGVYAEVKRNKKYSQWHSVVKVYNKLSLSLDHSTSQKGSVISAVSPKTPSLSSQHPFPRPPTVPQEKLFPPLRTTMGASTSDSATPQLHNASVASVSSGVSELTVRTSAVGSTSPAPLRYTGTHNSQLQSNGSLHGNSDLISAPTSNSSCTNLSMRGGQGATPTTLGLLKSGVSTLTDQCSSPLLSDKASAGFGRPPIPSAGASVSSRNWAGAERESGKVRSSSHPLPPTPQIHASHRLSSSLPSSAPQPPQQSFRTYDDLLSLWKDGKTKTKESEWKDWMRLLTIQMLKHSKMELMRACIPLAELHYPTLCALFPIGHLAILTHASDWRKNILANNPDAIWEASQVDSFIQSWAAEFDELNKLAQCQMSRSRLSTTGGYNYIIPINGTPNNNFTYTATGVGTDITTGASTVVPPQQYSFPSANSPQETSSAQLIPYEILSQIATAAHYVFINKDIIGTASGCVSDIHVASLAYNALAIPLAIHYAEKLVGVGDPQHAPVLHELYRLQLLTEDARYLKDVLQDTGENLPVWLESIDRTEDALQYYLKFLEPSKHAKPMPTQQGAAAVQGSSMVGRPPLPNTVPPPLGISSSEEMMSDVIELSQPMPEPARQGSGGSGPSLSGTSSEGNSKPMQDAMCSHTLPPISTRLDPVVGIVTPKKQLRSSGETQFQIQKQDNSAGTTVFFGNSQSAAEPPSPVQLEAPSVAQTHHSRRTPRESLTGFSRSLHNNSTNLPTPGEETSNKSSAIHRPQEVSQKNHSFEAVTTTTHTPVLLNMTTDRTVTLALLRCYNKVVDYSSVLAVWRASRTPPPPPIRERAASGTPTSMSMSALPCAVRRRDSRLGNSGMLPWGPSESVSASPVLGPRPSQKVPPLLSIGTSGLPAAAAPQETAPTTSEGSEQLFTVLPSDSDLVKMAALHGEFRVMPQMGSDLGVEDEIAQEVIHAAMCLAQWEDLYELSKERLRVSYPEARQRVFSAGIEKDTEDCNNKARGEGKSAREIYVLYDPLADVDVTTSLIVKHFSDPYLLMGNAAVMAKRGHYTHAERLFMVLQELLLSRISVFHTQCEEKKLLLNFLFQRIFEFSEGLQSFIKSSNPGPSSSLAMARVSNIGLRTLPPRASLESKIRTVALRSVLLPVQQQLPNILALSSQMCRAGWALKASAMLNSFGEWYPEIPALFLESWQVLISAACLPREVQQLDRELGGVEELISQQHTTEPLFEITPIDSVELGPELRLRVASLLKHVNRGDGGESSPTIAGASSSGPGGISPGVLRAELLLLQLKAKRRLWCIRAATEWYGAPLVGRRQEPISPTNATTSTPPMLCVPSPKMMSTTSTVGSESTLGPVDFTITLYRLAEKALEACSDHQLAWCEFSLLLFDICEAFVQELDGKKSSGRKAGNNRDAKSQDSVSSEDEEEMRRGLEENSKNCIEGLRKVLRFGNDHYIGLPTFYPGISKQSNEITGVGLSLRDESFGNSEAFKLESLRDQIGKRSVVFSHRMAQFTHVFLKLIYLSVSVNKDYSVFSFSTAPVQLWCTISPFLVDMATRDPQVQDALRDLCASSLSLVRYMIYPLIAAFARINMDPHINTQQFPDNALDTALFDASMEAKHFLQTASISNMKESIALQQQVSDRYSPIVPQSTNPLSFPNSENRACSLETKGNRSPRPFSRQDRSPEVSPVPDSSQNCMDHSSSSTTLLPTMTPTGDATRSTVQSSATLSPQIYATHRSLLEETNPSTTGESLQRPAEDDDDCATLSSASEETESSSDKEDESAMSKSGHFVPRSRPASSRMLYRSSSVLSPPNARHGHNGGGWAYTPEAKIAMSSGATSVILSGQQSVDATEFASTNNKQPPTTAENGFDGDEEGIQSSDLGFNIEIDEPEEEGSPSRPGEDMSATINEYTPSPLYRTIYQQQLIQQQKTQQTFLQQPQQQQNVSQPQFSLPMQVIQQSKRRHHRLLVSIARSSKEHKDLVVQSLAFAEFALRDIACDDELFFRMGRGCPSPHSLRQLNLFSQSTSKLGTEGTGSKLLATTSTGPLRVQRVRRRPLLAARSSPEQFDSGPLPAPSNRREELLRLQLTDGTTTDYVTCIREDDMLLLNGGEEEDVVGASTSDTATDSEASVESESDERDEGEHNQTRHSNSSVYDVSQSLIAPMSMSTRSMPVTTPVSGGSRPLPTFASPSLSTSLGATVATATLENTYASSKPYSPNSSRSEQHKEKETQPQSAQQPSQGKQQTEGETINMTLAKPPGSRCTFRGQKRRCAAPGQEKLQRKVRAMKALLQHLFDPRCQGLLAKGKTHAPLLRGFVDENNNVCIAPLTYQERVNERHRQQRAERVSRSTAGLLARQRSIAELAMSTMLQLTDCSHIRRPLILPLTRERYLTQSLATPLWREIREPNTDGQRPMLAARSAILVPSLYHVVTSGDTDDKGMREKVAPENYDSPIVQMRLLRVLRVTTDQQPQQQRNSTINSRSNSHMFHPPATTATEGDIPFGCATPTTSGSNPVTHSNSNTDTPVNNGIYTSPYNHPLNARSVESRHSSPRRGMSTTRPRRMYPVLPGDTTGSPPRRTSFIQDEPVRFSLLDDGGIHSSNSNNSNSNSNNNSHGECGAAPAKDPLNATQSPTQRKQHCNPQRSPQKQQQHQQPQGNTSPPDANAMLSFKDFARQTGEYFLQYNKELLQHHVSDYDESINNRSSAKPFDYFSQTSPQCLPSNGTTPRGAASGEDGAEKVLSLPPGVRLTRKRRANRSDSAARPIVEAAVAVSDDDELQLPLPQPPTMALWSPPQFSTPPEEVKGSGMTYKSQQPVASKNDDSDKNENSQEGQENAAPSPPVTSAPSSGMIPMNRSNSSTTAGTAGLLGISMAGSTPSTKLVDLPRSAIIVTPQVQDVVRVYHELMLSERLEHLREADHHTSDTNALEKRMLTENSGMSNWLSCRTTYTQQLSEWCVLQYMFGCRLDSRDTSRVLVDAQSGAITLLDFGSCCLVPQEKDTNTNESYSPLSENVNSGSGSQESHMQTIIPGDSVDQRLRELLLPSSPLTHINVRRHPAAFRLTPVFTKALALQSPLGGFSGYACELLMAMWGGHRHLVGVAKYGLGCMRVHIHNGVGTGVATISHPNEIGDGNGGGILNSSTSIFPNSTILVPTLASQRSKRVVRLLPEQSSDESGISSGTNNNNNNMQQERIQSSSPTVGGGAAVSSSSSGSGAAGTANPSFASPSLVTMKGSINSTSYNNNNNNGSSISFGGTKITHIPDQHAFEEGMPLFDVTDFVHRCHAILPVQPRELLSFIPPESIPTQASQPAGTSLPTVHTASTIFSGYCHYISQSQCVYSGSPVGNSTNINNNNNNNNNNSGSAKFPSMVSGSGVPNKNVVAAGNDNGNSPLRKLPHVPSIGSESAEHSDPSTLPPAATTPTGVGFSGRGTVTHPLAQSAGLPPPPRPRTVQQLLRLLIEAATDTTFLVNHDWAEGHTAIEWRTWSPQW